MSTTETDFWSRIDSEPTPSDASATSASQPESNQPESNQPESVASEGNESTGSDAASRESSTAPPADLRVARPEDTGAEKSKSRRIREFLADHPEVRNRDIVEALGEYGVTAADVSNVRTQLRKKAEKQQKAKSRVESSATPQAPAASPASPASPASASSPGSSGRRAARGPAPVAGRRRTAASGTASTPGSNEIAMTEIEAGLSFIEQAGGIERARQVIELIARIRDVRLDG